jgi:hypothetical protein
VTISRAIYFDANSFSVRRRRDAAYFLFRSYFENYGVEENPKNTEQAIYWLHEFAQLGITSEEERLCFDVAEFSKRIGRDMPSDFALENCLRIGLKGFLNCGFYMRSLIQERTKGISSLSNELLVFREEGLRRLLPQQFRSTDLSAVLSTFDLDSSLVEAAGLLHIAASCGDIQTASLLVEKFEIDLNMRASFQDITPLITALKFSQTEFVLWLLRQGVKAGIAEQRIPVLTFLCNFDTADIPAICTALCEAGAGLYEACYFDFRLSIMDMLSFAVWAFDLATIEISELFQITIYQRNANH